MTAEGGKKEAAGGHSEQGKRRSAQDRRRASGRPARTPADRPPADGGSGAPPQRGEHKRRGPAPHLAKPGVQPGAESASGGLGVPRALPLARGMTSPERGGQRSGGATAVTALLARRLRVKNYWKFRCKRSRSSPGRSSSWRNYGARRAANSSARRRRWRRGRRNTRPTWPRCWRSCATAMACR